MFTYNLLGIASFRLRLCEWKFVNALCLNFAILRQSPHAQDNFRLSLPTPNTTVANNCTPASQSCTVSFAFILNGVEWTATISGCHFDDDATVFICVTEYDNFAPSHSLSLLPPVKERWMRSKLDFCLPSAELAVGGWVVYVGTLMLWGSCARMFWPNRRCKMALGGMATRACVICGTRKCAPALVSSSNDLNDVHLNLVNFVGSAVILVSRELY